MLARTWLHEITDTLQELTTVRDGSEQGVVREHLASQGDPKGNQCVLARMREYAWLSRKWEAARSDEERSRWEVELAGTARDIELWGRPQPSLPWAGTARQPGADAQPDPTNSESLRVRYAAAADEELRAVYVQEREQQLHDYRQRLAEAHPADREAIRQEFAKEWAHLVRRHDAGRFSLRILAYCTEWDPQKGGIAAVNQNLVEGLAAVGHEVFVRVGHEVPPDASGDRIHLIGPRRYDSNRGEQEQLVYDGEDLPSDVDAIIGHSRYSGPQALQVRNQLYPDTPFVQVIHMVTGALARVANRPDLEAEFEGIERRMVAAADMVAGVGPVLENEARRLAATNPGDHFPAVHQIIPGVPFEEQQLLPWDGERTRHLLLVGRADAPQKGPSTPRSWSADCWEKVSTSSSPCAVPLRRPWRK
ncbi:hypothetical protein GCM10012280_62960 [Wenjunlia tyrosinilytica]|uniref:Glycosyltransferase n=1 Tax=Wenjunlia tyrosinilytica TaxID=1544741 RepID=A0A917ZWX6_9ACTN|nr:hypothetical protein [Wenjunlia tyrosinilytica]GGO98554.1 hypothetical protein GCM10012280_62960 [Wenjunlia tyrosinilytica]